MLIKDLAKKTQLVRVFDCDLTPGFSVEISYLGKKEITQLYTRSSKLAYNPSTHVREDKLDQEKFDRLFALQVILGWSGLTVGKLKQLVPVEGDVADDQIIEFSEENAIDLVSTSTTFNGWLSTVCMELENFIAEREATEKNSPPISKGAKKIEAFEA